MRYWTVPKFWVGRTVAVMASGPSMSPEIADKVTHLPRVTVNDTIFLAPDAEIIYAGDAHWWNATPAAMNFRGIKATIEAVPCIRPGVPETVRILANTGRDGYEPQPWGLRTHANSGAQAVQIAAHAGAARILLLGFDMQGGHWHEPHPAEWGDPNPKRFARWIERFRVLAAELASRGVDVINCTPGSALDSCRFMSLDDALSERAAA